MTTHGFRGSFKTWARNVSGHANEVVEEALAHSLSALDDAYVGEAALVKRRLLMNDWSRYCLKPRPSSV